MNIHIETKPTYTMIALEGAILDTAGANDLSEKIHEQKVAGSQSFIVDMNKCDDMEYAAGATFMDLHHNVYEHGGSLVFCEMNNTVLQKLKKEQLHLTLNLTPTLIEAVDIVSMEALERDLFNEK